MPQLAPQPGPRATASRAPRARTAPSAFSWSTRCTCAFGSRPLVGKAAGRGARLPARSAQAGKDPVTATIEELEPPCDDFVCNSSPAVEQTVRAVARDLVRCTYSRGAFQPDAAFDDGFRSFKGTDRLSRASWVRDVLNEPKVSVTRMRMLDRGTAQIDWAVTGRVAVFPVTLAARTVVEMNLLTGRVTSLKESWDLAGVAAPASAALVAARISWSAQQTSRDASEGLTRTLDSLSSLASADDDQVYRDPTDPTKFFRQEDSTKQDALTFMTLLAILYAAYKAYATLLGA
ncbi:hypothetical protein Rsub_05619 [Raphidocelis subcapitata]|uniref:SnoaL-like domain-containing protein n=1 Tax=Raphidocelis subcapitata TaxID=307507 RepID=A0A2V0NZE4_9CHLO|nr:hypothetical protein Rsub_05619 [Raphidocelis subcapitata]|eukprot:GBF93008.1 hypothetical protein Rsub_05619 [Raphidocelis subcapitata]